MQTPVKNTGPPTWVRRYPLHVLLLIAIAGECLTAWALHRSAEEFRELLETGGPKQKVFAIHVLARRDDPQPPDEVLTRRMLNSPHALVREMTMTKNFRPDREDLGQSEHIASMEDSPERLRFEILRSTGKGVHLTPEKLRQFYSSLENQ